MATTTASQAWAILTRHARDDIGSLRLQELCRDNDRVSSLVAVHHSGDHFLLVDLSRQRMTLETLNHLLRLANTRDVPKFIRMLAWGQNDPNNPISRHKNHQGLRFGHEQTDRGPITSPTMHLALRAPADAGLVMLTTDGTNALGGIHEEWARIRRHADSLRQGRLRGVTGSAIKDIVVVGSGTPLAALRFLYKALLSDRVGHAAAKAGLMELLRVRGVAGIVGAGPPVGHRRMRFLSSVDPVAAASVVEDLDPASTMVITIALSGHEESGMASRTLKNWLLQSLGANRKPELVYSKHMLLVTGNDRIHGASKPESIFLIPSHSRIEPFTTLTSVSLLPLSIVFGWSVVKEVLAGAHDIDTHFVETNPRHNLPVLLALTDVYNDAFLGTPGRFVTPFLESVGDFPSYVSALESQVCGRPSHPAYGRQSNASSCGLPIDGGMYGAYDRVVYQGSKAMPSELVVAMDTQASRQANLKGLEEEFLLNQDALVCSMFAHADELAFGVDRKPAIFPTGNPALPRSESFGSTRGAGDRDSSCDGNRPSSLLMCGKLDAFACGQLIALSEHRAAVKAKLWGMDPFAREVGASIRSNRTDKMREKLQKINEKLSIVGASEDIDVDDNDGGNLSTATLLEHYATQTREQRAHLARR